MPAVSEKQARFMRMCAHNPGAAKGKCPSKSVAREFMHFKGASLHKGWRNAHFARFGIKVAH